MARFFAADWGTPAVIEVEGVEPFEMYGYPEPLLWANKGYAGDLPRMYGTGMNTLNFQHAGEKFDFEHEEEGPLITISKDGKTATTLISRYSGGRNGDGNAVKLVKIGDEWFVVSIGIVYVS